MNVTTSTSVPEVNTLAGHSVSQKQQESAVMYTLPYYATEVDAVHESIQKAIDLVQHYSEQVDYVDDASASSNHHNKSTSATSFSDTDPDEIYQQLDTARNQITESWQALYTSFHSKNDDDDNDDEDNVNRGNPLSEQEQIRIAYLNMITDSFGNVLANLHGDNDNNINVDVLADCLQSGYDLLTQFNSSTSTTWYENDFVWNDDDDDHMDDNGFDNDDDNDNEDDVVTPHERHRRQLGFQEVH